MFDTRVGVLVESVEIGVEGGVVLFIINGVAVGDVVLLIGWCIGTDGVLCIGTCVAIFVGVICGALIVKSVQSSLLLSRETD